jgi:long-chain acyl-CoA synthetase
MEEKTLSTMFLNRLDDKPDRVKFRFKREGKWVDVTRGQAGKSVRAISAGLHDLGLKKGDRVCILSNTRLEWTLADVANIIGGFITVPVYHSNLPDSIAYILENSGARAIFVEDDTQMMKIEVIHKSVPGLQLIIPMSGPTSVGRDLPGLVQLNDIQKRGTDLLTRDPSFVDRISKEIEPEDDLTIIYTSGTTGPPKGVVTTHRHYQFTVTSAISTTDIDEGETILHFLPFAHSLGRIEQFIALDSGLLSAYAENIQTVGDDMGEIKPHLMFSVPRLYEKFYERVQAAAEGSSPLKKKIIGFAVSTGQEVSVRRQKGEDLPLSLKIRYGIAKKLVFSKIRGKLGGRLRFFISGGAPLAKEIAEFFHAMDVLILEGYGLTESSTVASVNRIDRFKFGTVGPPMPGVKIKTAEDGEILIGGDNVFKEYINDPIATEEAKTADGWLKTGDIGMIDEDGFLTITDRKKDIIVTAGGKNIPPANIENMLKTDKFISQAFVYGDRKKYLTALITLNREDIEGWALNSGFETIDFEAFVVGEEVYSLMQERIEMLNGKLPSFQTIKKFVIIPHDFSEETGELTPTMKVKRKVVVQKYGKMLEHLYDD